MNIALLQTDRRSPLYGRWLLRGAALLLVVMLLAGCSGPKEAEGEAAQVRVENQRTVSITVFVVESGGQRFRLGQVGISDSETFDVPRSLVASGVTTLRFIAEPVSGDQPTTAQSLDVFPGRTVTVTFAQ